MATQVPRLSCTPRILTAYAQGLQLDCNLLHAPGVWFHELHEVIVSKLPRVHTQWRILASCRVSITAGIVPCELPVE
jgi:hypothetical protein